MGITKTNLFDDKQNELANLFKALGHPARIAILQFLMTQNSCVCGSIVSELKLAQATISQHLKVLKEVGVIQGTIEGTSLCYCINPEKFKHLEVFLSTVYDNSKTICCE